MCAEVGKALRRHNTSAFEQSLAFNNTEATAADENNHRSFACAAPECAIELRSYDRSLPTMTLVTSSTQAVGEEVVGDADGVGDDGEGRVNCAA